MKTSMLEYCKIILNKVSFDFSLFRKEYLKTKELLSIDEFNELTLWIKNQFNDINLLELQLAY